ncbi:hypothetical protein [Prescottella sp. R16]|uniref:hypothetical protein n=1 Tax=Prescottella sp. R16 TaxID=3064529 RepID=UPI00272E64B9|nr:hypothetical protein [Prescottella sp. R16]
MDGAIQVDGYPDAVKIAALPPDLPADASKRLADLAAHIQDLVFASRAAARLINEGGDPPLVRDALWRSAVVAFWRCFDKTSKRSPLDPAEIYGDGLPREAHEFVRKLRNKGIAHDDRIFTSYVLGAVIGPDTEERKVIEILFHGLQAQALTSPMLVNFKLLTEEALTWADTEFQSQASQVVVRMRSMSYEQLLALPALSITPPQVLA